MTNTRNKTFTGLKGGRMKPSESEPRLYFDAEKMEFGPKIVIFHFVQHNKTFYNRNEFP
jgi:hypothetical protein